MEAPTAKKPRGLRIIEILALLGGLSSIAIGAILLLGNIVVLPQMSTDELMRGMPSFFTLNIMGFLISFFGIVTISLGIVYIVISYGIRERKKWAWKTTIIVSSIEIIFGTILYLFGGMGFFDIVISGIIIFYMYRPQVKAYFGKDVSLTT